jgi:predicted AAA+ superfamily ATPase
MVYFIRQLKMDLPKGQSAFLWGPRKAGKSTYLKKHFTGSLRFDLLKTDTFLEFSKRPWLLREHLETIEPNRLEYPIIIDEIQKVPQLLDEVHWLIENRKLQFILCGSSARKLKREGANMLGGRAWRFEMWPLVSVELRDYNLLDVLNKGLLPSHFLSSNYKKALKAYIGDYLKEEVLTEGLTRNLPAFSRFLDAVGYTNGELVNYSNIASDCAIDAKTVKQYFQILEDTLLGKMIEPYHKNPSRQVISKTPKFYLFDVGVAGAIAKRHISEEKGEQFGKAFEHFILLELIAHRSYSDLDYDIHFWRTKNGIEVDFVLGNAQVAIEVKSKNLVRKADLRGLKAFIKDYSPQKVIVVCNESHERIHENINIMPYRVFLDKLWSNRIID